MYIGNTGGAKQEDHEKQATSLDHRHVARAGSQEGVERWSYAARERGVLRRWVSFYPPPPMRRSLLLALLLALPAAGCAGVDKSYRDFAAEPTPTLGAAGASVEAEGMITTFYGKDGGDLGASLPAAVARAPRHGGLREIAAYRALPLPALQGALSAHPR
jgi:hypothetical protein